MKLTANRFVFSVACAVAVLYAGAKHGSVTFPYTDVEQRYLIDAGSYVTNDTVHLNFVRSPIVPSDADLQGWYRHAGSTNDDEWAQMLDTTFGAFPVPADIDFEGAETNDFQFFTTWTPGPVVHTNGVAVIEWQRPLDASENRLVTIRTGIYIDGRKLAPNPGMTNGVPINLMGSQNGSD